jgi:hypothetical protein
MNLYDEAMRSLDADNKEADREREYQKREEQAEPLMKKLMPDFGKYFNDEGEDVRELAEKAEAQRDAIREDEIAAKFYLDAKLGLI